MKSFIDRILKLNNEFYQSTADEFSATRQKAWPGWKRILPYIESKNSISVLDIGCGNGRFLTFLDENILNTNIQVKYTGIDISQALLEKAKQVSTTLESEFISENIFNTDVLKQMGNLYDLVVAFGVTHHIPSQKLRDIWFRTVAGTVSQNGLLIISFWDFSELKKNKATDPNDGENDYYLGWNNGSFQRYCHLYSDEEITNIVSDLQSAGMEILEDFREDGRTGKMNKYIIMKRTYETK